MMSVSAPMVPGAPGTIPAPSKIKPQPNYPPNPTLYLSNIDWSIKKALLKRSLLALFSRHGKVLEVICLRGDAGGHKNRPLRGQAWVVFESLSSATAALEAERAFVFFGRPLMVNYSREVSDRIAKRDGTYGAKTKERRAAAAAANKRKMDDFAAGGEDTEGGDAAGGAKMAKLSGGGGMMMADGAAVVTTVGDPSSLPGQQHGGSAAPPPPIQGDFGGGDAKKVPGGIQPSSTPSSLLLAKNLPTECNDMMLAMLFRQYSGYKEVKLVGGGMATIEFGTENEATSALKGLNGFKLTTSSTLDLSYGER
mmetsp:Transcript_13620/g.32973  ORF Transcript_13620/g.32973 Transcript_13620/m.32973 type:complete len:309 (-) Transcript_13620:351-1277(-)